MNTTVVDEPNVGELSRRARSLTTSFSVCALFYVLQLLAPAALKRPYGVREGAILLLVTLALIASYIWYAIAAGFTARTLGMRAGRYVLWILLAPAVSAILSTIGIPILPTLLSASPLSIKFLLGNQLDEQLRSATSMNLSR